jgi:hypothetical protein
MISAISDAELLGLLDRETGSAEGGSKQVYDSTLAGADASGGRGIAAKHIQGIFEQLKRLHGNEIPGSGAGVVVCRAIVERDGGKIWGRKHYFDRAYVQEARAMGASGYVLKSRVASELPEAIRTALADKFFALVAQRA